MCSHRQQSNSSCFPTITEETKSFKISVETIFAQSSIQSVTPFSDCQRIVANFRELQLTQENSGKLEVSLFLSTSELLLKIIISFQKRPSSQVSSFNGNLHSDAKLLNSNAILQESFCKVPTKNASILKYSSISHNFMFNKSLDSLELFVNVENSIQTSNYKCNIKFGQYEGIMDNAQFYAIKSFLYTKQEDRIQPEEERDASDLSSTKSEFSTSPSIEPRNQCFSKLKFEETEQSEKRILTEENSSSTESLKKSEQASNAKKFDKKNVVKNFVKAFDGFFMDKKRDCEIIKSFELSLEQLSSMRAKYEQLEKSMRYNNKMIISIIFSDVKEIFEYFLRVEAPIWISNSSVFDKQAHKAILKDYLLAAQSPQDIPKIVNLRIRNRDQNTN